MSVPSGGHEANRYPKWLDAGSVKDQTLGAITNGYRYRP